MSKTKLTLLRIFLGIVLVLMLVAGVHGITMGDPGWWLPAFIAAGCLAYVLWTGRHKR